MPADKRVGFAGVMVPLPADKADSVNQSASSFQPMPDPYEAAKTAENLPPTDAWLDRIIELGHTQTTRTTVWLALEVKRLRALIDGDPDGR